VTASDSAEATAEVPADPARGSEVEDATAGSDAAGVTHAGTATATGAGAGSGADPSAVAATAEGEPAAEDLFETDLADAAAAAGADVRWADENATATALTWVDPAAVADAVPLPGLDASEGAPAAPLLRDARLRPAIARPGVLVPLGVLVALAGTYAGGTLLWPLHEVAPTVQSAEFATTPAAAAAITWPAQGSAGVGVGGFPTAASSSERAVIASVTKVVSSLMVLDRMPLAVGEHGPEFSFTRADNQAYWSYRRSDQSALDVPVGGTLTEYQMLQGTLLGSANNYIDRLVREIWGPGERAFAEAAEVWLRERGLEGITVVTPSGFDDRNVATPAALVALAERAMQNPVFAEIVGTASVDLPGAGTVVNTNGMLADAGVVGVKTGTLDESWNLLTAKDVTVDGTTVRLFASVLGQEDDDMRLEVTRSLFAQVESELASQPPVVPAGTVVGTVDTVWGATADIVTDADTQVVLWNSTTATTVTDLVLGEHRDEGDEVGTLTATGPLNSVTTPLTLAQDIEGPSAWWRLTHPLELLGLTDAQR